MIKKIITAFIALSLLTGILSACSPAEKVFEKEGFSITLTADFDEMEVATQTYTFNSNTSVIAALKENYLDLQSLGITPSELTVSEYASIVMAYNNLSGNPLEKDGLTYFNYEKTEQGIDFKYIGFTYKGADAFWFINMACETKNYDKIEADFLKWAKTVKI